MREIKFRGKNYGGIWLYGYLMPAEKPVINKGCKYRISVSPQSCAGKDKMVYEVISDTIGQYTGLKDKNGKEIYEGDILIEPGIFDLPRTVFWDHRFMRFGNISPSTCGYIALHDYRKPEIIGNIHDNPELLKHD